jgi:hypothetical protein
MFKGGPKGCRNASVLVVNLLGGYELEKVFDFDTKSVRGYSERGIKQKKKHQVYFGIFNFRCCTY